MTQFWSSDSDSFPSPPLWLHDCNLDARWLDHFYGHLQHSLVTWLQFMIFFCQFPSFLADFQQKQKHRNECICFTTAIFALQKHICSLTTAKKKKKGSKIGSVTGVLRFTTEILATIIVVNRGLPVLRCLQMYHKTPYSVKHTVPCIGLWHLVSKG